MFNFLIFIDKNDIDIFIDMSKSADVDHYVLFQTSTRRKANLKIPFTQF